MLLKRNINMYLLSLLLLTTAMTVSSLFGPPQKEGAVSNNIGDGNSIGVDNFLADVSSEKKASCVTPNSSLDVEAIERIVADWKNDMGKEFLKDNTYTLTYKHNLLKMFTPRDRNISNALREDIGIGEDRIISFFNTSVSSELNKGQSMVINDSSCGQMYGHVYFQSEYLFTKIKLIIAFGGTDDAFKAHLSNGVSDFHRKTYGRIVDFIIRRCSSLAAESPRFAHRFQNLRIISDLIITIIEGEYWNYEKTVEKYDQLVLRLVVSSIRRSNTYLAKFYLNYLINDNYMAKLVELVCPLTCSYEDSLKLFDFINGLPVSEGVIAGYVDIYGILLEKELMTTANVVLLRSVIEMKSNDIDMESIRPEVRTKLKEAVKYLDIEVKNYFKVIAESVVKSDPKKDQFIQYLKVPSIPLDIKTKYVDILIKNFYEISPFETEKICDFIVQFASPSLTLAGYSRILDILLEDDKVYNMEVVKLAHYIRDEVIQTQFETLKSRLPAVIRDLVWNRRCSVRNVKHAGYLYTDMDRFFKNERLSNEKEEEEQVEFNFEHVFLKTNVSHALAKNDRRFEWLFSYEKRSNLFLLENFLGKILKVEKRFDNENFHVGLSRKRIGRRMSDNLKWKLELVKADGALDIFTLKAYDSTDETFTPYVLYARGCDPSAKVCDVYLSRPKRATSEAYLWSFDCTAAEEESSSDSGNLPDDARSARRKRDSDGKKNVTKNHLPAQDNGMLQFLGLLNFQTFASNRNDGTVNELMESLVGRAWTFFYMYTNTIQNSLTWGKEFNDILIGFLGTVKTDIFKAGDYTAAKDASGLKSVNDRGYEDESKRFCKDTLNWLKYSTVYGHVSGELVRLHGEANYTLTPLQFVRIHEDRDVSALYVEIVEYVDRMTRNKSDECLVEMDSIYRRNAGDVMGRMRDDSTFYKICYEEMLGHGIQHTNVNPATLYYIFLNNETSIYKFFYTVLEGYKNPQLSNNYYVRNFLSLVTFLYRSDLLTLQTTLDVFRLSFTTLTDTRMLVDFDTMLFNLTIANFTNALDTVDIMIPLESRVRFEHLERLVSESSDEVLQRWAAKIIVAGESLTTEEGIVTDLMHATEFDLCLVVEKMVDYMYGLNLRNGYGVNRIRYFLSALPARYSKHGFDSLIEKMISHDGKITTEVQILASYVYEKHKHIPGYHNGVIQNIDDIMPRYVERLVLGRANCTLKNVGHEEYLTMAGPYFLNGNRTAVQSNGTAGDESSTTKWTVRTTRWENLFPYRTADYKWTFEFVDDGRMFLLKNNERSLYLSMGERIDNGNYRMAVVSDRYESIPMPFRVELFRNAKAINDIFFLYFRNADKIPFFFVAGDTEHNLDIQTRSVLISRKISGGKTPDALWEVSCN